MFENVCECVRACVIVCVGWTAWVPSGLNRPASFHPPIPLSMISPTTRNRYQREHRNEMDLTGFDNECTEIHRLSSLVVLQLF